MRIGLIRHFKVKPSFPRSFMVSQSEVLQWLREYEAATVAAENVDLYGINWDVCYASDLPRALETAKAVFNGPVCQLSDLREIQPRPIFRRNISLPFIIWGFLIRLSIARSFKSQRDRVEELESRLGSALDQILDGAPENILIVSHGVVMVHMRRLLVRRGFTGPRFGWPANGKLYVFEKHAGG